jgi:hypothetical protein
MAYGIELDPITGLLRIEGGPGADSARVSFAEVAVEVDGVTRAEVDTGTIRARITSNRASDPSIERSFPADAVRSIHFEGGGATDLFENLTTAVATWSTVPGGTVNTSLMVGSPNFQDRASGPRIGVFTVGQSGEVGVDYLFRGAGYAGQLGLYSLAGMDAFTPGTASYTAEVARRVLSGTAEGHRVIDARAQGARFSASLPWEGNMNKGPYLGIKTVNMRPGDSFAAVIVPSGTFEQVAANPGAGGSLRPLYSIPAANPGGTQFKGQVGDLDGSGSLFAFEDLRLDGSSDRDYNDLVFQVLGARGEATPVAEVVNPGRDFTGTTVFEKAIEPAVEQARAQDAKVVSPSFGAGTFVVGPGGSIGVDSLRDDLPARGEVALFSLAGMGNLLPGSPEFLREAARRALTGSSLGHVVVSDSSQASRGADDGRPYLGQRTFAMNAGDSVALLHVPGGTVWGVFSATATRPAPATYSSISRANPDGLGRVAAHPDNPSSPSVLAVGFDVDAVGETFTDAVVGLVGLSQGEPTLPVVASGSLCGLTYLDLDGDGEIDPADPTIGGIAVTLQGLDAANRRVSIPLPVDPGGRFKATGLPAGSYELVTADGSGRTYETRSAAAAVVRPGAMTDGLAAGRLEPATLRGFVYADDDHDFILDAGEAGIPGVDVTLVGVDDLGQAVVRTAVTLGDGRYAFEGLRPGTYELREAQPDGWLDGRESRGTFLGLPRPIDRNGKAIADGFAGIRVLPGETGSNYNFGEWSTPGAGTDGTIILEIPGTPGDDEVIITLGAEEHRVLMNGELIPVDAAPGLILRLDGLGGADAVRLIGRDSGEILDASPGLSTLDGPGLRVELLGVADLTFEGGAGDRSYLTDTPGDDLYTAAPLWQRLEGDGHRVTVIGVDRSYAYGTSGGSDTASLLGSGGADTLKATPSDARLYGDGFWNMAIGFDRVTGQASGAQSRAYLYDSAGDDELDLRPGSARLLGEGFALEALGFSRVDATAMGGGADRATLGGSRGDDRYFAGPGSARLLGEGFDLNAFGFASAVGSGGPGGFDRAYLTSSQGDDLLEASHLGARLTGPGLDVSALAFPWVRVIGTGTCASLDRAILSDSPGDDTFEADPGSARLHGRGYTIRVEGFSAVEATASAGGLDRAVLGDSAGDDTFEGTPGSARHAGLGFDHQVSGFGAITLDAWRGGFDRAVLIDSAVDDVLEASGSTLVLRSALSSLTLSGLDEATVTGTGGRNARSVAALDLALEFLGEWLDD